jgi:hypothetical protein
LTILPWGKWRAVGTVLGVPAVSRHRYRHWQKGKLKQAKRREDKDGKRTQAERWGASFDPQQSGALEQDGSRGW